MHPDVAYRSLLSLVPGGTRFIGAYLARQLIEDGNEVTLLTRGKAPITSQIPDDTDSSYAEYKNAVRVARQQGLLATVTMTA